MKRKSEWQSMVSSSGRKVYIYPYALDLSILVEDLGISISSKQRRYRLQSVRADQPEVLSSEPRAFCFYQRLSPIQLFASPQEAMNMALVAAEEKWGPQSELVALYDQRFIKWRARGDYTWEGLSVFGEGYRLLRVADHEYQALRFEDVYERNNHYFLPPSRTAYACLIQIKEDMKKRHPVAYLARRLS